MGNMPSPATVDMCVSKEAAFFGQQCSSNCKCCGAASSKNNHKTFLGAPGLEEEKMFRKVLSAVFPEESEPTGPTSNPAESSVDGRFRGYCSW